MKSPDLGKVSGVDYPEFTLPAIEANIGSLATEDANNATSYKAGITLSELGSFRGFRIAEYARRVYLKNQNTIFACGVIASRQDKLKRLKEAIKGKNSTSDIQKSIDKEERKYEQIMVKMNCNQNMSEKADDKIIDRLSRSAMLEYCGYTYYLDYLDENLRNDYTKTITLDDTIGTQSGTKLARDTEQFATAISGYRNKLASDRARANDTVPKAIMAFQEMDRTYITHLLLVIIYDDYLQLRDNLNKYLSIVSQTFEKAFNAMDDNQN